MNGWRFGRGVAVMMLAAVLGVAPIAEPVSPPPASARLEAVSLAAVDSRLAVRVTLSGRPGIVAVHREGDAARVSIAETTLGARFAGGTRFAWTPAPDFDLETLSGPTRLDRLEVMVMDSEVSVLLHVPPEVSIDVRRDRRGLLLVFREDSPATGPPTLAQAPPPAPAPVAPPPVAAPPAEASAPPPAPPERTEPATAMAAATPAAEAPATTPTPEPPVGQAVRVAAPPVLDGNVLDDPALDGRARADGLSPDPTGRGTARQRAHRGAHRLRRRGALHRRRLLRPHARRHHRLGEPARLAPREHRQLPGHPRHLLRPPQRVRVRDQPDLARVRRSGRQRGRGQPPRPAPTERGYRGRVQPELGRGLAGPHPDRRLRLERRVRDPVPDAALRRGRPPDLGHQLPAQHPAPQRDRVLGAPRAPVRPVPPPLGGDAPGPGDAEPAQPQDRPVRARGVPARLHDRRGRQPGGRRSAATSSTASRRA